MMVKRYSIHCLLFLFAGANAGSFSTGIGVGMTHALLAPKISYEFENGLGVDGSIAFYRPGVDFCIGVYYSFKFLRDELYIGPRVTVGQRDPFNSTFTGVTVTTRTYFLRKNYFDVQLGFEGYRTAYMPEGKLILFEPAAGVSYGFEFTKKCTDAVRVIAPLGPGAQRAILTGKITGWFLTVTGIVLTGVAVPFLFQQDEFGLNYIIFGSGIGTFTIGAVDLLIMNKLKYE